MSAFALRSVPGTLARGPELAPESALERPPFRRGWKALGSCSWEITLGTDANAKVGFHGATPTAEATARTRREGQRSMPRPAQHSSTDRMAASECSIILAFGVRQNAILPSTVRERSTGHPA